MAVPFPHHHQIELVRTLSSRARLEAAPRQMISGGPSPEFDGDVTSWSPEQLLLDAIALCLLTTFEAFAARDHVELLSWQARAHGTVNRSPEGLQFSRYLVEIEMEVDDIARARATLDQAQQVCLVTNALRAPVEIVAEIRSAARQAG